MSKVTQQVRAEEPRIRPPAGSLCSSSGLPQSINKAVTMYHVTSQVPMLHTGRVRCMLLEEEVLRKDYFYRWRN